MNVEANYVFCVLYRLVDIKAQKVDTSHWAVFFSSQFFSSLYKLLGVECSSFVVTVVDRAL